MSSKKQNPKDNRIPTDISVKRTLSSMQCKSISHCGISEKSRSSIFDIYFVDEDKKRPFGGFIKWMFKREDDALRSKQSARVFVK